MGGFLIPSAPLVPRRAARVQSGDIRSERTGSLGHPPADIEAVDPRSAR